MPVGAGFIQIATPHPLCDTGSGHQRDGHQLQDSSLDSQESLVKDGNEGRDSALNCRCTAGRNRGPPWPLQLIRALEGVPPANHVALKYSQIPSFSLT